MKNKKNISTKKMTTKIITKSTKKMTKKSRIRKNKNGVNRVNSVYDGGAAFTRGGFGCLFKPALNCKDSELNMNPNYVSKLIETKHGERGYL